MSLTFHRTFSLSRTLIAQVLKVSYENSGFSQSTLAQKTDLGTVQQEAMPRYAYRAGLLDKKRHLTSLGNFVVQHDSTLETAGTQWLLHYNLSAPHGPTPFWHHLVTTYFLSGNTFNAKDLIDDLAEFLQSATGKAPSFRSLRSTITIFTGTYLKTDGLNRLRVLEEIGKQNYRVMMAPSPPIWTLGYALMDYWKARYGERLTINMIDITRGDFASIFLLGEERLAKLLLELQREGMIELHRISQPYQIVLLQPNLEFALKKLYAF